MQILSLVLTFAVLFLASLTLSADWTTDKGVIRAWKAQDIVVTISQTPLRPSETVNTENLEQVCLGLTMSRMLQQSHNVTVFVRNDGVYLVDETMLDEISARQPFGDPPDNVTYPDIPEEEVLPPCVMPDAEGMPHYFTLKGHLDIFMAGNDNNLVNCPICAGARGFIDEFGVPVGDYPYAGILPLPSDIENWEVNRNAIPSMLMGADKVIDF